MPVPPSVPTSFVPHSTTPGSLRKRRFDFGGAFGFIAYILLATSILSAGGVFGYEYYLKGQQVAKDAELSATLKSIDQDQVSKLLHLRDRLDGGKNLLDNHVALSGLLDVLEKVTLGPIRFSSLTVSVGDGHTASISISGTAATFNALAAQSTTLGHDTRLKSAIFSGLAFGKDGSVSFSLTADVDPALIAFGTAPTVDTSTVPAVVATTTPKVATTTVTTGTTVVSTSTPKKP